MISILTAGSWIGLWLHKREVLVGQAGRHQSMDEVGDPHQTAQTGSRRGQVATEIVREEERRSAPERGGA